MIRIATINDFEGINRLGTTLGYEVSSEEHAHQRLLQVLNANNTHHVWVYEEDGRVLGWIHGFVSLRVASEPFIEIGGIVVDDAIRRMGIGTKLIEHIRDWADELGYGLRVRSNTKRQDTHDFYKALGLQEEKEQYVFIRR